MYWSTNFRMRSRSAVDLQQSQTIDVTCDARLYRYSRDVMSNPCVSESMAAYTSVSCRARKMASKFASRYVRRSCSSFRVARASLTLESPASCDVTLAAAADVARSGYGLVGGLSSVFACFRQNCSITFRRRQPSELVCVRRSRNTLRCVLTT